MIVCATVLVDQFTKFWALATLTPGQPVPVLDSFFMLTLVFNEGGAMGTRLGSSTYYLIASLIVLAVVLYYMYRFRKQSGLAFPLALIAGGAIGNIVDRVRLGRVVDFLDFDFFDLNILGLKLERWWTFNVADAAITCSILFLVLYMIFDTKLLPTATNTSSNLAGESTPDSSD